MSLFTACGLLPLIATGSTQANDSTAVVGAGGIVLTRSFDINLTEETLYLSQEKVKVDYIFHNRRDFEIETVVAFPMPDIKFDSDSDNFIPDEFDNFMGFSVEMGGKAITPNLEQRAIAANNIDVTERLKALGIPLVPTELSGLPEASALKTEVIDDLVAWGIVRAEKNDQDGKYRTVYPAWTLRSAYWWKAVFPADQEVKVSHEYRPALGGTAGVHLAYDEPNTEKYFAEKYCAEPSFVRAVRTKVAGKKESGGTYPSDANLSYILSSGANWNSYIDKLKVIVDKGAPENLVTFCTDAKVTKTSDTTFEFEYIDISPDFDLDVYFVNLVNRPE